MVMREFSENLASEFKTRKPVARTNGATARFRAWAILDGCEEAFQSMIHVGREKVPIHFLSCEYAIEINVI